MVRLQNRSVDVELGYSIKRRKTGLLRSGKIFSQLSQNCWRTEAKSLYYPFGFMFIKGHGCKRIGCSNKSIH